MRQHILDQIKNQAITGIRVTNELPYDESGTALYIKNPKTIYVDNTQYESEPVLITLDGCTISTTATVVIVYFTTDAKDPPFSYDNWITTLRSIANSVEFDGAARREAFVSTSYESDLLITELEYRLTRLN